jgi:hypothetical protein
MCDFASHQSKGFFPYPFRSARLTVLSLPCHLAGLSKPAAAGLASFAAKNVTKPDQYVAIATVLC